MSTHGVKCEDEMEIDLKTIWEKQNEHGREASFNKGMVQNSNRKGLSYFTSHVTSIKKKIELYCGGQTTLYFHNSKMPTKGCKGLNPEHKVHSMAMHVPTTLFF